MENIIVQFVGNLAILERFKPEIMLNQNIFLDILSTLVIFAMNLSQPESMLTITKLENTNLFQLDFNLKHKICISNDI